MGCFFLSCLFYISNLNLWSIIDKNKNNVFFSYCLSDGILKSFRNAHLMTESCSQMFFVSHRIWQWKPSDGAGGWRGIWEAALSREELQVWGASLQTVHHTWLWNPREPSAPFVSFLKMCFMISIRTGYSNNLPRKLVNIWYKT